MFAGTNHGIFYLTSLNGEWQPATMIRGPLPQPQEKPEAPAKSSKTSRSHSSAHPANTLVVHKSAEHSIPEGETPRIRAFEVAGDTWYAASNDGLFVSVDHGRKWYGGMVEGEAEFIAVNSFSDGTISLVAPKRAFLSHDQGKSWSEITYPAVCDRTLQPDGHARWLVVAGDARRCAAFHRRGQELAAYAGRFAGARCLRRALRFCRRSGCWQLRSTPMLCSKARTAATAGSARRTRESPYAPPWTIQGRILATSTYNGLFLQQSTEGGASAETAHAAATSSTADRQ